MMMTNPNTLSIVGTKRQHGRVVLVIEDNAGRVDRSLISRWEVAKRDLANAVHDFAACCGAEERTTRRDRYGLPIGIADSNTVCNLFESEEEEEEEEE